MNAIEPRFVALLLLLGWMAIGSESAVGQCDSPVTVANTSTTLGAGLRAGQSFVAAESGELQSVMLGVCEAVDAQLVIRQEGSGDGAATWNDGGLLGTSWAVLGDLGPSWRRLGPSWRRLGGVLGGLGAILMIPRAVSRRVRRMRVGLSKGRYLPFLSLRFEHAHGTLAHRPGAGGLPTPAAITASPLSLGNMAPF